jgi:hypothetical protein
MIIDVTHRDPFAIFRIKEFLDTDSNLNELYMLIKEYLKKDYKHFAVGFSKSSFFYSKAIAGIILCIELIQTSGGSFSIIEANHEITDVVASIDDDGFIATYQTEEELIFNSVSLLKKD